MYLGPVALHLSLIGEYLHDDPLPGYARVNPEAAADVEAIIKTADDKTVAEKTTEEKTEAAADVSAIIATADAKPAADKAITEMTPEEKTEAAADVSSIIAVADTNASVGASAPAALAQSGSLEQMLV